MEDKELLGKLAEVLHMKPEAVEQAVWMLARADIKIQIEDEMSAQPFIRFLDRLGVHGKVEKPRPRVAAAVPNT